MPEMDGYTAAQMRRVHALARQRGLVHEDLRAIAGVGSLTELDRPGLARLIDHLEADRRRPGRCPPPAPLRLSTDATDAQRAYLAHLFGRLGWTRRQARAWLRQRHGVVDLDRDRFDRSEATRAINELEAALAKGPGGRRRRT